MLIRQINKKYSVKTVVLMAVSLLLVACVAVSLIFINIQGNWVTESDKEKYISNMKSLENHLNFRLTQVYYELKFFCDEDSVRNFVKNKFTGHTEVRKSIDDFFVDNDFVEAMFFFINDGQEYMVFNGDTKKSTIYLAEISENINAMKFSGVVGTDNKKYYFSLPVYDEEYKNHIGYISCMLSENFFRDEITLSATVNIKHYIIAYNSTPITAFSQNGYTDLPENWFSDNYNAGEYVFRKFKTNEKVYYASQFTVERYGVIIYFVIPRYDIEFRMPAYFWFALGLFVPVVLFTVFMMARLLRFMSNSLSSIDSILENIEELDGKQFEKMVSVKEFYDITEKICAVSSRMVHLNYERLDAQKQALQKEITKRNAILTALKNQINPHFFYNTLACVKQLSTGGNINAVPMICDKMVQILRYSINNSETAKVYEEIDALESYLYIQSFRFQQQIFYKIDIEESIMDCDIPRFILQPILENSIMHGILSENKKGKLTVSGVESDGKIIFRISDNGVGIDSERLKKLQEKLSFADGISSYEQNDGHGIGLTNINKRIKLSFGDEYGIKINSILNIGTFVTVEIPIDVAQKEAETSVENCDN